jgi:hypothetical protein
MPPRRKAADFFTPDEANASGQVEESQGDESMAVEDVNTSSVRRSSRLHRTPSATPDPASKTARKNVLQLGKEAARQTAQIEVVVPTIRSLRAQPPLPTSPSVDETFVDAPESPLLEDSHRADATVIKSPETEDQYDSAVEDITEPLNLAGDSSILDTTPRPSHTQNTLENIPSSQPRPRSQRSPVPLQPVSSSPPLASLPLSTPASQPKSTTASAQPIPPTQDDSEDSDDEAPEPISLSQSRSQALASQTKLTEQQRLQTHRTREKRRKRDAVLASQKHSRKRHAEQSDEEEDQVADSQTVESSNSTDAPAPNQAHQAARLARHAEPLPADLLRAANSGWFVDTVGDKAVVKKKKRKVPEDDGVRILEEMNLGIAPKAGTIGLVKEKMIMRMGKGERRMFVGRFTR